MSLERMSTLTNEMNESDDFRFFAADYKRRRSERIIQLSDFVMNRVTDDVRTSIEQQLLTRLIARELELSAYVLLVRKWVVIFVVSSVHCLRSLLAFESKLSSRSHSVADQRKQTVWSFERMRLLLHQYELVRQLRRCDESVRFECRDHLRRSMCQLSVHEFFSSMQRHDRISTWWASLVHLVSISNAECFSVSNRSFVTSIVWFWHDSCST